MATKRSSPGYLEWLDDPQGKAAGRFVCGFEDALERFLEIIYFSL